MSPPVFVVVGNVNRGKSSVVSTLAADERVAISPTPGTTVRCQEFPMRVNGQTLYTLIDSPGFERARAVLAWLEAHQEGVVDRHKTVERFVAEHTATGEFAQEVELLRPILEGAAVLYVVDGSKPFGPRYEAEMEILRWTGAPRLALINRVTTEDHAAEWRSALDQYFNMVRDFNAHAATFEQRVALLGTLRELREGWREPLDRAIAVLREDRERALRDSAAAIADMLVDMLTMTVEKRLPDDAPAARYRHELSERYYRELRRREAKGHDELRRIYLHGALEVDPGELTVSVEEDLFSEDTWATMGLKTAQLVGTGASAGALTGGLIDASVGGASFMAGTVIGSVVGGAGLYLAGKNLPKVKIDILPNLGRALQIGPMKNSRFPWIVLNRAALYHDAVANRSHARRDKIALAELQGQGDSVVARLPSDLRGRIGKQLARVQGRFSLQTADTTRRQLAESVAELLQAARPAV